MFCSVKTDEGDDAGFISLSGHLTHICMFPQARSHQIHAARLSSQQEVSSSGVQKCDPKNVECAKDYFTFYTSCI